MRGPSRKIMLAPLLATQDWVSERGTPSTVTYLAPALARTKPSTDRDYQGEEMQNSRMQTSWSYGQQQSEQENSLAVHHNITYGDRNEM